jgi:TonB family protein
MARAERFAWLRRDGAPLTVSLVLHVLALVLIAPWLVMRTIPAPQVEVEVMLEPDIPEPPSSRPEKALRLRDLVKVQRPLTQSVRAPRVQLQPLQAQPLQSTVSQIELPPLSDAPAAQAGQGQTGQSAPAPREVAGLSAPGAPGPSQAAPPPAAAPASPDEPAPQRDSMQAASPSMPSTPSLGSTPQPSSRAAAAPSRAGLDQQDGPVTLAGPAPQAQAAEPEFRQAARQGGQASMRGGSQAPDDGLARQQGAIDQTALFASRSAPQSVPGGRAAPGGQPPALAAPAVRSSGRGSVAAAETATPTRLAQLAPSAGGQGAPSTSRAPAPSGQGSTPGARGSVAAAETTAPTGFSQLAGSGSGQGVPSASRAPAPSGRGSSGSGPGSLAAVPGERGSGLMAAANPGTAGPGTAASGTGPGASVAGEGRAQRTAGVGSAARETAAAPLLAAGGGPSAAQRAGADGGAGQLSGRTQTAALAQPVRETPAAPLQTQQPSGQARVIEERFTATALKVDSPRTICELPLMFAGFDRKPIPQGLDSINATAARLADETPPRHHPGNQAPRYPMQALGLRAEGRVLVRAEIRPDGTIGQQWVKQTSGVQVLDLAALETVRGWRFYPAQRHGMAVAVWMDVPIEYKLP